MSAFDGIDRSVATTLAGSWLQPGAPMTEDQIGAGIEQMVRLPRQPLVLLPAGLYDVVASHGWGKEALAWLEERRRS